MGVAYTTGSRRGGWVGWESGRTADGVSGRDVCWSRVLLHALPANI